MHQEAILEPIIAMWGLTLVVLLYMAVTRIGYLIRHKVKNEDVATRQQMVAVIPPRLNNPSDNFRNLFEMPVLFYAVCTLLLITQEVDSLHLNCAWAFVGFRAVHSAVHCTINVVPLRFTAYLLSCAVLIVMMVRLALAVWA